MSNTLRILIIEDEKPAARRLKRLLESQDVLVEHTLHSVKEAVEYLLKHPAPDLIFLDIQLSDGLSFEIFDQVNINSAIIFTTAYDEYALQAFKLNSIDYLLKPIDEDELIHAVDKYRSRFRESEKTSPKIDFTDIAKLLQNPVGSSYKKRFTARVGEHLKLFQIDEIQLFYSENKGTYIHTHTGRNYLIDQKLEAVEQELDPQQFYRISRQAIVHVTAIADMVNHTNSRLIVKIPSFDSFDLVVSRERVKDFKAWLEG
jgi:DNA-binding LytR/AlgR family response regulator